MSSAKALTQPRKLFNMHRKKYCDARKGLCYFSKQNNKQFSKKKITKRKHHFWRGDVMTTHLIKKFLTVTKSVCKKYNNIDISSFQQRVRKIKSKFA